MFYKLMSEKKKIKTYITVTLVLSFLYQAVMALVANDPYSEKFVNFALVLMYFPGLIALAFMLSFNEGFKSLGWSIKRPRFLLYSIAIPLIVLLSHILLVKFFGIGSQSIFIFENKQIIFLDKEMSIVAFIPYFLIGFVLKSLEAGIFAFGEELGWRGYLQNKMIREFGIIPGIILLGLVWGYWHLPVIFMGLNFPEHPILGGFVLMPLATIGLSSIFAWLTLHAKSIWPAVLAHGAINVLVSDDFVKRVYADQGIWIYLVLIGVCLIAGIVFLVMLKIDEKKGRLKVY